MKEIKKEELKRIIAVSVSMILANLCCCNSVQIKADDKISTENSIQVQTNAPNLIDNYDGDSILCNKLEYDVENNTTGLKDDVEENLNRAGIFDEEINDLDEETIDELNRSINTSVYIDYVSVDEEKNGNVTEMKNDEIDDIIEERIEEDKIDYEEDETPFEKIGKSLGIIPTDVGAKEPLYDDWNHPKTKNKVKQTIYACQFKKKGKIYVTAKAYWLDEAYYRNVDVFGVTVKNGNVIRNTAKCKHTATYRCYSGYGTYIKKNETHPDAFKNTVDGVACKVNLFGNRRNMKINAMRNIYDYYDDEYIELKFQCRYEKKYVIFATSYNHAMTNKSISPSISIGSEGISVGVSGSSTNYYIDLSYNAYLDYKHI